MAAPTRLSTPSSKSSGNAALAITVTLRDNGPAVSLFPGAVVDVLATIEVLTEALTGLLNKPDHEVRVIGTRHGEKLYESLVSREEMAKAEDMGRYYRIPADNRDLNYKKYFVEGEEKIAEFDDYTSHNTERLDIEGIKQLLLKLDYIKEQLDA